MSASKPHKRKATVLGKGAQERIAKACIIHGSDTLAVASGNGRRIITANPHAGTSYSASQVTLGTLPPALEPDAIPLEDFTPAEATADVASKPSKNTTALLDMVQIIPQLMEYYVEHDFNSRSALTCECGRGKCLVSCEDCTFYEAACRECFIETHRCNPFHWARVWNEQEGFFIRADISVLRESYAIQLGHQNGICPSPQVPSVKFVVTCDNGVHATRISFCDCFGSVDRVAQLMRAKMFPGSCNEPISSFSLSVLKQYDIHSLQAKISAYDYCLSLRRLTDNVFTHLVNDPYQPFMRIARIYRFMKAKLRLGQMHGIDGYFPHRPAGALVVYCPQCPRPGENMGGPWWHTPRWLR